MFPSGTESVTWKTYDWSKHESEHYDPVKGERAYGLVIFAAGTRSVFLVQNIEKMWGFPKGHREDGESGLQAAIRETLEETGLIVQDPKVLGEVSMSHEISYPEDKLNQHITKQLSRGEKPHWNQPGKHPKSLVCYVVEIEMPTTAPKYQDDEVSAVGWYTVEEARVMIPASRSNQISLLEDAVRVRETH